MDNRDTCFNRIFSQESYCLLQVLSDGKLSTEDGYAFSIHRIELARKNKYFYHLFCGIGKGKSEFLIPGVSGEALSRILSYIYTRDALITEDNVCELLVAADYLMLDDLIKDITEKFMRDRLSVGNCLPLYITALQINQTDILKETFRFVQTHFEAVVTMEDSKLGNLPLEALKLFLSDKNLGVQDESTVWSAIVQWVQTDITHRQFCAPVLLMHLAVSNIDEQLASSILEHDLVTSNAFCEEIRQLKMSSSSASNLQILLNYIESCPQLCPVLCDQRCPEQLHFIAHYCIDNQRERVHVYVTYDEKTDLWREIFELDSKPDFMASTGHDIYVVGTAESRSYRFNLIQKEWYEISDFRLQHEIYKVVQLERRIYVIGRTLQYPGTIVDVYDPELEMWRNGAASMITVTDYIFKAAALGKRIFVISVSFSGREMIAQAYDAELDAWAVLPAPFILRSAFAVVAYCGKLYVIGGRNDEDILKSVEVFDPSKNEWTTHKHLPCTYRVPQAIVLNGQIIVYDNILEDRSYWKTNPAVYWDDSSEDWNSFEELSPMNMLHRYCFFTTDDRECISSISKENKDPKTQFEKSPFN